VVVSLLKTVTMEDNNVIVKSQLCTCWAILQFTYV